MLKIIIILIYVFNYVDLFSAFVGKERKIIVSAGISGWGDEDSDLIKK